MLLTVVAAAILGDTVGYEIGRHYGARVLRLPVLEKRHQQLDRAQALLARRGGPAVFLGRWIAFFRAVMPALAGTAHMRYRTFLAFNAAGGIVWGVVVVFAGYAAGASYARIERVLGRGSALVALTVVLIGLLVWHLRRRKAPST